MTKQKFRRDSCLFFFFSVVFTEFLINSVFTQTGWSRIISVSLFGFLIWQQLRVAFLMRQKYRELNLK